MYHFFALLSRMKYIHRWALMRNTKEENLAEHSLETAYIAHALALIRNRRFKGNIDPEKAAVFALYHDTAEILTGDLPTPVKYDNPTIKNAYRQIEKSAQSKLLSLLPEDLRNFYQDYVTEAMPEDIRKIVKAADKLSAVVKCMEEEKAGNKEFISAKKALLETLRKMELPEVSVFMEEFLPSFSLNLDELSIL